MRQILFTYNQSNNKESIISSFAFFRNHIKLFTILFWILSSILLSEIGFSQKKDLSQPNIVFLLVDDMGYGECGFNGGREISTPNIDRLSKEGTVLENSYVQPVCSPTRAALLTGRYPTKTGVYTIVGPGAKWGLPLAERTLADALRAAGYNTAIAGKWHLGEFVKAYQPSSRGFNEQYGFYFGNIDYFTHERNKQPDWYRNGIALKEEGYSTHLITKEACRIIENAQKSKPFFLYVPFNGIHAPYQVPDQYMAAYPNLKGDRQKLAGMLAAVDEGIGQIVNTLNKTGLRENTLIIFLSDNGAPPPGVNFPLRDFKATIYEGGIRGASFVNWPGHIAREKRITEPMHVVDWYPTLVKLAGGSLQQALAIDGLDIWPMITNGEVSPHEAILFVSTHGPKEAAIRMGNWKLIALGVGDNGLNEKPNPKMLAKYGLLSLYDLANDPGETTNLAEKYPEKVKIMKQRLSELLHKAVPSGATGSTEEKEIND